MARAYYINGETMVAVKGPAGSAIASLTNLGLADSPIVLRFDVNHDDIAVDAYGGALGPPPEIQAFLTDVQISMSLVHFDADVLDICTRLALGGATSIGQLPHAGQLLGNGQARFGASNNYVGLNLYSPVGGKPWRFYFTYMTGPALVFPLGTRRTIAQVNWRCIPYSVDPWNAGLGAFGQVLWDNVLDT